MSPYFLTIYFQIAETLLSLIIGRCQRLFNSTVCSKVIKIICQWSIAGAAVKECPRDLQQSIIQRWMKNGPGVGIENMSSDIDTLMKSANQTSFLYNLAIVLWREVS